MNSYNSIALRILTALMTLILVSSCKEFFNPDQELNLTEDHLYDDWYEYRSVEMGLYSLQQDLAEQIVVLGELRADLLTITPNADADLVEIYNFNVSKNNKYASPTLFFKLIGACNNFSSILKEKHPEILDPGSPITNYDRLYGEVLCMRAWAYFNAVRIYGKVPFIHESLTTIEEIQEYVNSPGTYVDSVSISFSTDGYYNDTTYNEPITLEKQLYDLDLVIDYFTNQLEHEVKAVGVNHHIDNNDVTWEITIWSPWSMDALLGVMYLTQGNLVKAADHFDNIMYNPSETYRYQLDNSFANSNWRNIFTNIDNKEHIFTIWFNKANMQQNEFQSLFEPFLPHKYMLKPTFAAIQKWEAVWRYQVMNENLANPGNSEMIFPGIPGDFYRGYGSSFLYVKNGMALSGNEWMEMLDLRSKGDFRGSGNIMDGVDTIVFKYSINKDLYDEDANLIIYRAAGIHLYMAEVYTWWAFNQNGLIRTNTTTALGIVNNGSNYDISQSRVQMGVRGRVGLGSSSDGLRISNIAYTHDPYNNEITGYRNLTNNLLAKQQLFEEEILDERARELAFEGERFNDLVRVAKRRNDPSFLARMVSAKYPAGKREQMYTYLLDESHWYINFFN
jgi:starch-binding outer membrane protein, SusD/RagB family